MAEQDLLLILALRLYLLQVVEGGGAGMAGYEEGGNGAGASLGTGESLQQAEAGASLSPIFGIGYCLGGTSGRNESTVSPSAAEGKNGAMRISYLDYGPGASGGGAGNIVPVQKISVSENALINIKIGRGGSGGNAGSIDSAGSIKRPSVGSPCSLGNNEEEAVATQLTDKKRQHFTYNICFTLYGRLGRSPSWRSKRHKIRKLARRPSRCRRSQNKWSVITKSAIPNKC